MFVVVVVGPFEAERKEHSFDYSPCDWTVLFNAAGHPRPRRCPDRGVLFSFLFGLACTYALYVMLRYLLTLPLVTLQASESHAFLCAVFVSLLFSSARLHLRDLVYDNVPIPIRPFVRDDLTRVMFILPISMRVM